MNLHDAFNEYLINRAYHKMLRAADEGRQRYWCNRLKARIAKVKERRCKVRTH